MLGFYVSRKGGTGGRGWGHLQSDMHKVVARLGCKRVMAGTRWATPYPECMDRLYKTLLSPCRGLISARKAAWALSRCMTTESADYCMFVNE